MNPVEVLALELRQFAGENGLRTLAPTLFGQTEESRGAKASSPPGKQWTRDRFFDQLAMKATPEVVDTTQRISVWMEQKGNVLYGHGRVDGSITCYFLVNGLKLYPMTLSTQGKIVINFYDCMKPPFDDEPKRQELLRRLNSIPGVELPSDSISRYPSIQLATLARGTGTEQLLSVMDWFASECNAGLGAKKDPS
jgi:hypothetical protein